MRAAGFLSVAQLQRIKAGRRAAVAGLVISAQRPPTAKGMGFIVLEDETGRVQVALPPKLAGTLRPALAESRILVVGGKVERAAGHVTLLAGRIEPYRGTSGNSGASATAERVADSAAGNESRRDERERRPAHAPHAARL